VKRLVHLSLAEFTESVASQAPAPGGGSVAALAGAQAAALLAMVCRLTIGKKKYAAVEAEVLAALPKIDDLHNELLRLVDADAAAYDTYAAAVALPKESSAQQEVRRAAIQNAARTAAEAPLRTLAACHAVAEAIHRLYSIVNRNCLSDSGTAMQLALAGAGGAAMNVLINLPQIDDPSFRQQRKEKVDSLLNETRQWSAEVTAVIFKDLTTGS